MHGTWAANVADTNRNRVIVLGTHSFVCGGTKVGSQYPAKGLAASGW